MGETEQELLKQNRFILWVLLKRKKNQLGFNETCLVHFVFPFKEIHCGILDMIYLYIKYLILHLIFRGEIYST